MRRVHWMTPVGFLALCVGTWVPHQLMGQENCVPPAGGVPGLGGGPKWRGGPTGLNFPQEFTKLDDPRWRGSTSHDYNGEVELRTIYRGDSLYLSWQGKVDPTLDTDDDQLLMGFKLNGTFPAIVIHLTLKSTTIGLEAAPNSNPGQSTDPVSVRAHVWNSGWKELGVDIATPVPDWMKTTTPGSTRGTTRGWTSVGKPKWVFQMVVPISTAGIATGLDLPQPTFQVWYAFLVKMPSTGVARYVWPSNVGFQYDEATRDFTFPNPTSLLWGSLTFGAPPAVNCTADLALSATQIGTENTPPSKIKVLSQNVVFAKPENVRGVGGTPVPAGSVQARFFIANWGTQLFDPTLTSWKELEAGTAHINVGDIEVGVPLTDANDISFPWLLTPAEQCMYVDPPVTCTEHHSDHQCILVQLSLVTGAAPATPAPKPLVFRNQSVYRNMDFDKTMSPLKRKAEVSVVGLAPLPDGRQWRDVYLYVETVNMPATRPSASAAVGPVIVPGPDKLIVARGDTTLKLDWGVVRLAQGDSAWIPTKDTIFVSGNDAHARFEAIRQAAHDGRMTADEIDASVPTYRVHAYHATGDSIILHGVKHPILEAQTSFGYWVDHAGEVVGWTHRIEGERLIRLAPNYYRIEVPNNGTTTITTTIEALERPPFALSLHAGVSIPHGALNNAHDPGFGITADAEYWWKPRLAVAALLGYHRFNGQGANPDLDLVHVSAALEARVTTGQPSVIVDAGVGVYDLSPGPTDPGVHAGAGLEFDVTPTVSLGFTGRVHTVFTTGSNTTFSSLQAGGRIRF